MADSTLAGLTAATALDGDELLYLVDDPSGTPADRKVTAKLLSGAGVIAETTLGSAAAGITFSSIPATFRHLRIIGQVRSADTDNDDLLVVRFNGVSTGSYHWERVLSQGSSSFPSGSYGDTKIVIGTIPAALAPASSPATVDITIPNYAQTTFHKTLLASGGGTNAAATANVYTQIYHGIYAATGAITDINLFGGAVNLAAGSSFTLYGLRGA